MRGIDSTEFLPLNHEHRWRIFRALGMGPRELNQDAFSLMNNYNRLPHVKVLAVLGVLGSTPNGHGARISPQVNRRIRHFLASRLTAERKSHGTPHGGVVSGVDARRGPPTVNAVIRFIQHDKTSSES